MAEPRQASRCASSTNPPHSPDRSLTRWVFKPRRSSRSVRIVSRTAGAKPRTNRKSAITSTSRATRSEWACGCLWMPPSSRNSSMTIWQKGFPAFPTARSTARGTTTRSMISSSRSGTLRAATSSARSTTPLIFRATRKMESVSTPMSATSSSTPSSRTT